VTRKDEREHNIEIGGRTVPVRLRTNARARRIILRTDSTRPDGRAGVVVTLPRGVVAAEALAWTASQTSWIARQLGKLPDRIPFAAGAVIPLFGQDLVVRSAPEARRGVWTDSEAIYVSGRPEHLARRLADWLKREARKHITERAREKAQALGVKIGRVSVRDTKSRWGSCAVNGNLNFSWRLVMTPEFVFDYVVAHEVAHIREHNHGRGFWQLVETITGETERARAWLNAYGAGLHRYG
jgi:predicted metal-dependent hydrolase